MIDIENSIAGLDLSLFEAIESQSTDDDKRSLLAIQSAVRELKNPYTYVEIGSYLGGSIQPHLLDPRCERIFSIDKRPGRQADERGINFRYLNNTTERMLKGLSQVAATGKISTIDGDSASIKPETVDAAVDLCFIDGEHTDRAVVSDFRFCLDILAENGAIVFHDAMITYNGIDDCIRHLERLGVKFRAYSLPSILFVVEINDFPLHRSRTVLDLLTNNHRSYLYSLRENDHYRRFAQLMPFRIYRRLVSRFRGNNICK